MKMSNLAFDMAEEKAEAERQASIDKAQDALREKGSDYCVDCGEEISPKRRAALPSAKRCMACQTIFERKP